MGQRRLGLQASNPGNSEPAPGRDPLGERGEPSRLLWASAICRAGRGRCRNPSSFPGKGGGAAVTVGPRALPHGQGTERSEANAPTNPAHFRFWRRPKTRGKFRGSSTGEGRGKTGNAPGIPASGPEKWKYTSTRLSPRAPGRKQRSGGGFGCPYMVLWTPSLMGVMPSRWATSSKSGSTAWIFSHSRRARRVSPSASYTRASS